MPLKKSYKTNRSKQEKIYLPELHFFVLEIMNLSYDRLAEDTPELAGFVGTELAVLKNMDGRTSISAPVEINGIYFVHYLANPFSSKPYGGTAMNQPKR
ncbi:MAG: hypothetical protein IPJ54_11200 [Saprospiraceae bacterium]|nr:hypothetical protein [Saprospiraceae bacterium]